MTRKSTLQLLIFPLLLILLKATTSHAKPCSWKKFETYEAISSTDPSLLDILNAAAKQFVDVATERAADGCAPLYDTISPVVVQACGSQGGDEEEGERAYGVAFDLTWSCQYGDSGETKPNLTYLEIELKPRS